MKSLLINKAVQDIGMGTYNWHLFILCGFGWFADKYVVLALLFESYLSISLVFVANKSLQSLDASK